MAYGPQYNDYPSHAQTPNKNPNPYAQAQPYDNNGYAQPQYPPQQQATYSSTPTYAQTPEAKKALHYTMDTGKNGTDPNVYDLGNPYGNQAPPSDSGYGSVNGSNAAPPIPPVPGYGQAMSNGQTPPPGSSQRSQSRGAGPQGAPGRSSDERAPRDVNYSNPYGSPDAGYAGRPSGDRSRAPPRQDEDYAVPGNAPGYFGGPSPEPYPSSRPGTAHGNGGGGGQGGPPTQPFPSQRYDDAPPPDSRSLAAPRSGRDAHYSTYGEEHIAYYTSAHADGGGYDGYGQDNGYANGPGGGEYGASHGAPPAGRPYDEPRSRGPPGRGPMPPGGMQRDMHGPSYQSDPGPASYTNGPDPYGRPPPDRSRAPPGARRGPPPPGMDPRRPHPPMDPRRRPPPRAGTYDERGPRGDPRGDPRGNPRGAPPAGMRDPRRPDYDPRSKSRPPPGVGRPSGRSNPGDRPPPRSGDPNRSPNAPGSGNMPPRPNTAPGQRPIDRSRTMSPPQAQGHGQPGGGMGLGSKPLPIRPGLQQNGSSNHSDRPPPVRQYSNNTTTQNANPGPNPSSDTNNKPPPITQDALHRLRQTATSRPHDTNAQLNLAKSLVEASTTLTAGSETNKSRYLSEATSLIHKLSAPPISDASAQFYYADALGSGALGLPNDPKEAFMLYQAAAKSGHAQASYRTAVCCEIGPDEGGGTRRDVIKALQWYRRAASLGDGPAMFKLGVINLKGLLDQPKNIQEGAKWLTQAAEKADEENPHALHELAILYEGTENPGAVQRDESRALQLFTQGAKLGYRSSQFRLGQAWEYGLLGCPIDARNSIIWYTRAAAQGEHNSELALSGWYLTGAEGILEHSDTEAYLWARKAASSQPPVAKALFALGYFTEVGIGCVRSLEGAGAWYGRAASFGFTKAQERLDELKKGGARVQKNRERLSRSNQKQTEAECAVM